MSIHVLRKYVTIILQLLYLLHFCIVPPQTLKLFPKCVNYFSEMQIRKFSGMEWNSSHRHLGEGNGLSYLRAWEMLGNIFDLDEEGIKSTGKRRCSGCGALDVMWPRDICLLEAANVSGLIQVFSTQSPKPVWRLPHNCQAYLVQAARFCHYSASGQALFSTRDVLTPHLYNLQRTNGFRVSSGKRKGLHHSCCKSSHSTAMVWV